MHCKAHSAADSEVTPVKTVHRDWVRDVRFSPCGGYVASASDDGSVQVIRLEDNRVQGFQDEKWLKERSSRSTYVLAVDFSPAEALPLMIAATHGSWISAFTYREDKHWPANTSQSSASRARALWSHRITEPILSVAVSPRKLDDLSLLLAVAQMDKCVSLNRLTKDDHALGGFSFTRMHKITSIGVLNTVSFADEGMTLCVMQAMETDLDNPPPDQPIMELVLHNLRPLNSLKSSGHPDDVIARDPWRDSNKKKIKEEGHWAFRSTMAPLELLGFRAPNKLSTLAWSGHGHTLAYADLRLEPSTRRIRWGDRL